MGKFSHHLGAAAGSSIACAVIAGSAFHTNYTDAAACAVLCLFGGILPDVDSPRSHPAELVVSSCSVLAPVFALQALNAQAFSVSEILLTVVLMYGFARYAVREFIRRLTVHRGIVHSVPFAFIFGALVFLVYHRAGIEVRQAAAISALVGYITHLAVDELFSFVDISGRQFTPKRSAGSALKFFSPSLFVNMVTYSVLVFLLFLCGRNAGLI